MKKIIILSSLVLLLASKALAVSFTTPIHLGDLVDYSVNCSSEGIQDPPGNYTGGGNSWQLFNSDGSNYGISGGAVCLTNWNYSGVGIVPGDYTLVEFNPTSQIADINAVALSTETSDPGFVASGSVSILADPPPTGSDIFTSQTTGATTTYTLSDNGWILLNEFFRFATFALAFLTLLLSFGFYFAITSKK